MRQKRHDPDEGSAEESYADHEEERRVLEELREDERGGHSDARGEHGSYGHPAFAEAAEDGGGVAAARKRKEQTRREIQIAGSGSERGAENYEIHDVAGGGNAHRLEYAHERAFAEAELRPRNDAHDDREPPDVKKNEG